MRKVIVTGGSGFIGQAVVRHLVAEGFEVATLARTPHSTSESPGVHQFSGDIADLDFLNNAFVGIDTVIHLAAKTGIWGRKEDFFKTNVIGTQNVLAACKQCGVSALVFASTPSVVFDKNDLCGINERTPYSHNYLCHYTHSKSIAEGLALAANSESLKVTVLRPNLVWGPGDTNLIPRLLGQARCSQLRRIGDGRNLVDVTYIDNAADAFVLAAKRLHESDDPAGKVYFISQGEPVNLWNWINKFFRRLDLPVVERRLSFSRAYYWGMLTEACYSLFRIKKEPCMTRFLAVQLARSHWFSIENAIRDLGYTPKVTTADGINRVVDWVKNSSI
ncbi:MAG: NAD-dependent epimerase/dehydratase family protein [Desulfobulbaceae bacterium]|nr:NAD-dependent epimerase/dehydratase family protein [Desulfobulbaceae bacterium]HIJ80017.1 NAD-dependent epimerase/dehydratase family protein [Deltaproteobacteria bacterium]